MQQINIVGEAPMSDRYCHQTFDAFRFWEEQQAELQLDIETDISPWWCDKKLITVQFGQVGHSHGFKHQWVLQWSFLDQEQKDYVKQVCENPRKTKLIHNAAFECIVLHFYGIVVVNVFDTMLAEKILQGGLENADFGLSDLMASYFQVIMDKTYQKQFGDNILTEGKVVYAAQDVVPLDSLRARQLPLIKQQRAELVLQLENLAVLSFSDITYHGMELDQDRWRANEALAKPVVEASLARLNAWLTQEPFHAAAISTKVLYEEDHLQINFNAPAQKSELLRLIFPDIIGASQPIIKKYINDNGPMLGPAGLNILVSLQEKNSEPFSQYLVRNFRMELIERSYLLPAGTPCINWNSQLQALPILQAVHPKLKDLSEESLNKYNHPIIADLEEYKDSLKLLTTYGPTFIEKYVEPDGRVRTQFNQIISTGRCSSSKPNMQQIPVKKEVGTRYRNAFVCGPDEVFVDSDYVGQELVILADISKEPVWLSAISLGQDLHSVCAEMVYGLKWLEAKEDDCSYYKLEVNAAGVLAAAHKKCKCANHQPLRYDVKTVNFGIPYGMEAMKLSGELRIPLPAAKLLLSRYFKAFPKIAATVNLLGRFGVNNGYTMTIAPFCRRRTFPFWKFAKNSVHSHLSGQMYNATLGSIERAARNHPIQGTAADMMKTAMVKVRRYIYAQGLQDKIRIVAQVHDQLTTICKKDIAEQWKVTFDGLMEAAAKVSIPSGILKADTQITNQNWTK